jgi:thiamine biosynthesis lipoprotein
MRRFLALVLIAAALALALWRVRREGNRLVEVTQQRPVMGTLLTVTAYAPDQDRARAAIGAAGRAVFRVDSLMSTWRPESEISRLNAAAGSGDWTPLSRETLAVLLAAQTLAELSAGAFDVTVGPLMQVWGFRGGEARPPTTAVLDSVRALVGRAGLELDSAGSRARLRRAGVAVDVGAIAKGYALDLAAAAMRAQAAAAGKVDLGGNVFVFGTPPHPGREWVIGILDPRNPTAIIGEIRLREGSVATSGDYEQFFEVSGIRYSHIMDPRRGEPARGILQTTVVAPTGLQADALSTTLFVLGPAAGRTLLDRDFARGAAVVWVRDSLPIDSRDAVVAGTAPERIHIALPRPR